jgi:hypothetical protein
MLQIGFQGTVTILTYFRWAVNYLATLSFGLRARVGPSPSRGEKDHHSPVQTISG